MTSLSSMMSNIDQSIVNIALPTIARELHTSAAGSVWVVNAFQFAVTTSLIPFAAFGDIFGYALMYRVGLSFALVASLVCSFAPNFAVLTIGRAIQGLGSSAVGTSADAIVRHAFPRAMLGRATGIGATAVAIGVLSGPVLGGAILSVASWPWLFRFSFPIILIILILTMTRVMPTMPRSGRTLDWPSAGLSAVTLGLLVVTLGSGGHGQPPLVIAGEVGALVVLGTILIRRQRRIEHPVFPVDLFARPIFALSIAASVTAFVAQTLAYVSLPFLFQTVFGRSVLDSGLLMMPWLIGTGLMSPFAGYLSDRYDPSLIGAVGLMGFSGGLALLATLPDHAATWDIVWRMGFTGLLYGLFQSPNNRVILGSVPRNRSGASSSMKSAARVVGQTTGAAIAASVFTLAGGALAHSGSPSRYAVELNVAIAAGLAALAALWSAARFRRDVAHGNVDPAR
jgi:MFS transporter, DHA2 family, multidrug resistance protein